MFSIFKRFFKFFQSEAHSVVDKMEDPVKMTEQGIRDLRQDLQNAMKELAEAKASSAQIKRQALEKKTIAADYENKAVLLLKKAEKGEINVADADRLATEALGKKDLALRQSTTFSHSITQQDGLIQKLEVNVGKIKEQISSWESELTTLKSRSQVATATKKLNQQMAKIDSSGTIALLDRMKQKVEAEEALAESYGELAAIDTSLDAEISRALGPESTTTAAASDSLAALKSKLGLDPK